jgi:hypothetical protein
VDEFAERAEVLSDVFDMRKFRGSQLKGLDVDAAIRVHARYDQMVNWDDFGDGTRRRKQKI